MSTFANPSIASNGLVLNIDAGNPRSFASEENFVLYSEDFSNAVWDKTTYPVTVALSTETPPLPGMTVYSLTSTNNLNLIIQQVSTSITGQGQLTASVYAKAGTSTAFTLNPYYNGESEVNITFTLTGDGSVSGGTGTITKLDNGWYRCSCPVPATTATRSVYLYRIWPETRGTYTTKTLYVAGAQTVTGGLSPYVRTTSAGVARTTSVIDATTTQSSVTVSNGAIYTNSTSSNGYWTFDGVDDYIGGASLTTTLNGGSMEMWLYLNAKDRDQGFFTLNASGSKYINFWMPGSTANANKMRWEVIGNAGNAFTVLYSNTVFTTGVWYHVLGTFDGSNTVLYINGVSDISQSNMTNQPSGSYTATIDIGRYGATYPSSSRIAIARFYNVSLTATQVAQNFAASRQRFGL